MDSLICQVNKLTIEDVNWETIIEEEVRIAFRNLTKRQSSYNDCVLDDFIVCQKHNLEFCHKLKMIQMKLGSIWQNLMGHVTGITNLGIGHSSGLDLLSDDRFPRGKFIMELKNSVLTDNASSRKHNISKLKSFVSIHPDYIAVYGYINDKMKNGRDEVKDCVRYLSGQKLLKFIFGDHYMSIISILKQQLALQIQL